MVAPFPSKELLNSNKIIYLDYESSRNVLVTKAVAAINNDDQEALAGIAAEEKKLNQFYDARAKVMAGHEKAFSALQDAVATQVDMLPDNVPGGRIQLYKDLKFATNLLETGSDKETVKQEIIKTLERRYPGLKTDSFDIDKYIDAQQKINDTAAKLKKDIDPLATRLGVNASDMISNAQWLAIDERQYGKSGVPVRGDLTVRQEAEIRIRDVPILERVKVGFNPRLNDGAGGADAAAAVSEEEYRRIRNIPQVKQLVDDLAAKTLALRKYINENDQILKESLPLPFMPRDKTNPHTKKDQLTNEWSDAMKKFDTLFPENSPDIVKNADTLKQGRIATFRAAGIGTNYTPLQITTIVDALQKQAEAKADTKLEVPLPKPAVPPLWVMNVDAVQRFADNQPKAPEVIAYSSPTGMPQELRVPQIHGDGKSSQKTV